MKKFKRRVRNKYGVTEEQVNKMQTEGLEEQWEVIY